MISKRSSSLPDAAETLSDVFRADHGNRRDCGEYQYPLGTAFCRAMTKTALFSHNYVRVAGMTNQVGVKRCETALQGRYTATSLLHRCLQRKFLSVLDQIDDDQ